MHAYAYFRQILNNAIMENEVIQRIREIILYAKMTERAFAINIGFPPMTINSLFKRNSDPGYKLLNAIACAFPDLSSEWLLRGEGPMLKSETPNKEETETLKKFLKQTDALLAIRDERIRRLELQNAALISGSDIKEVGQDIGLVICQTYYNN